MGKRRRVGGKCTRREKSRSRSESQTKQGRFYKCSAKLLVIDVLISLVQAARGCPIIYCVGALQRKLASFPPPIISALFWQIWSLWSRCVQIKTAAAADCGCIGEAIDWRDFRSRFFFFFFLLQLLPIIGAAAFKFWLIASSLTFGCSTPSCPHVERNQWNAWVFTLKNGMASAYAVLPETH